MRFSLQILKFGGIRYLKILATASPISKHKMDGVIFTR